MSSNISWLALIVGAVVTAILLRRGYDYLCADFRARRYLDGSDGSEDE